MEAATVQLTRADLQRVLTPVEQSVMVMLARNGTSEHGRRHIAMSLKLEDGLAEVDRIEQSARDKVASLKAQLAARQIDESRDARAVAAAAFDAAGVDDLDEGADEPMGEERDEESVEERVDESVHESDEPAGAFARDAGGRRAAVLGPRALELLREHGSMRQADLRKLMGLTSAAMATVVVPAMRDAGVEFGEMVERSPMLSLPGGEPAGEPERVECVRCGEGFDAGDPMNVVRGLAYHGVCLREREREERALERVRTRVRDPDGGTAGGETPASLSGGNGGDAPDPDLGPEPVAPLSGTPPAEDPGESPDESPNVDEREELPLDVRRNSYTADREEGLHVVELREEREERRTPCPECGADLTPEDARGFPLVAEHAPGCTLVQRVEAEVFGEKPRPEPEPPPPTWDPVEEWCGYFSGLSELAARHPHLEHLFDRIERMLFEGPPGEERAAAA